MLHCQYAIHTNCVVGRLHGPHKHAFVNTHTQPLLLLINAPSILCGAYQSLYSPLYTTFTTQMVTSFRSLQILRMIWGRRLWFIDTLLLCCHAPPPQWTRRRKCGVTFLRCCMRLECGRTRGPRALRSLRCARHAITFEPNL